VEKLLTYGTPQAIKSFEKPEKFAKRARCGDFPFAKRDRWRIQANEYDCHRDKVGCNERIYNAGLARCLI